MIAKQRQELAQRLEPFLADRLVVDLSEARAELHRLAPHRIDEIDGMMTSYILRRAGFARDYIASADPGHYRRKPGR